MPPGGRFVRPAPRCYTVLMTTRALASRIVAFFFAPLIIIVGLYFILTKDAAEPAAPVPQEEGQTAVSSEEQTIKRDTRMLELEFSYPEIAGVNETAASRINADLKMQAERIVSAFETQVEHSELFEDFKNSIHGEYQEVLLSRGIVSVPLMISEYASGAAHPFGYSLGFNYDAATGVPLTLALLFDEDAEYLDRVASLARTNLDRIFAENEWTPSDWVAEGTAPIEDNYEQWYVDGELLVIVFNPYQVAPYVYGIIEVPIPLADLADILRKSYR